jgi:hypothetical protein
MAGTSVVRVTPSSERARTTAAGSKSSWITSDAPSTRPPSAVMAAAAWYIGATSRTRSSLCASKAAIC